ncbi:alpha/beta hydrolase [Pseudogracilibacillus sp. SO10305]|uniref:alpha/beta hydrolase n=1 Tax=Pseudogracilibacillus sp. SO10305 TaxID=3098292 RepID=UPI00300E5E35
MSKEIFMERNIVVGKTDREYLTADYYSPVEGKDLPILLLIHGGGFESGSKEKYNEWGPYLAKEGYAALSINYRLATPNDASWPGVVDDVQSAINWLVSNANELGIEPLKMAIIGDSAGAHIGALYILQHPVNASFKIRASIGIYGVYDLLGDDLRENEEFKKLAEKLIGSTMIDNPEKYRLASPNYYIEEAVINPVFNPSFLLIWGETDKLVPPSQSKQFAKNLEAFGLEVETLSIPDKGHLWFNITANLEGGSINDYPNTIVAPKILEFLKKNLTIEQVGNNSEALIKNISKYR